MPEKKTIERARRDKRQGKSASTQAGEFVRQEMDHIRDGKHGARSTKQAIAIGLSEARRAGVKLAPPKRGTAATKKAARSASAHAGKKTSAKRSRATRAALEKEPRSAASHTALSRHAKSVARSQSASTRSKTAKKAARTRARTKRSS
jgi:hypothetical protein